MNTSFIRKTYIFKYIVLHPYYEDIIVLRLFLVVSIHHLKRIESGKRSIQPTLEPI